MLEILKIRHRKQLACSIIVHVIHANFSISFQLQFQINLILLANSIEAIAKQEKIIKKPLNLKPTKTPAKTSLIDEFRHLPAEDLEFIKQIDKQFKLHGENITIKVERENITKANKNSKRTIEGSLGYGKLYANLIHCAK